MPAIAPVPVAATTVKVRLEELERERALAGLNGLGEIQAYMHDLVPASPVARTAPGRPTDTTGAAPSATLPEVEALAGQLLVLRALAHEAHGWLASEPRLHVKRVLGEHAYDDARSAQRLHERLGVPDAMPGPQLAVILDLLAGAESAAAYERLAYGAIKPALARAAAAELEELDPRADEPAVHALVRLVLRQQRHADEIPIADAPPPGVLPVDIEAGGGGPWVPPVRAQSAPPDPPLRDPFVELGAHSGDRHSALNAELLAAEVAARTAYEHPAADRDLLVDLARIAADRLRRAAAIDVELVREGVHWGERPVDVAPYAFALGGDVGARLAFAAAADDPVHERIVARWAALTPRTA